MAVAEVVPRRRGRTAAGRRAWPPYLVISPAMLAMLAFLVYPMASVFYYSLRHYNVSKPWDNGFAGLDNFARMLTADPLFWQSLGFTAKWVVVEVTLQLLLGLALAVIVNETFVGRAVARALVFSPWAFSGVLRSRSSTAGPTSCSR